MRKIILAILVVAVVGLLLFGCAPKPATPKTTKIASTPVTAKESVAAEPSVPAEETETQEEPAVEPRPAPPLTEPVEAKKAVSAPVTQEELDKLKKGIQGIETEDLGGLSQ
ncbi:hypothetical protein HZB90_02460 [archaeon]|nr:hypothetical protein [archaeon]